MKETFKVRKNFFFKGVFLIKSLSFKDKRGEFIEKYNEIFFKKSVKKIKFVEDDLSFSKNNVFRGIHADNKAWKLFSCIYGTITLFFLDLRIQEKNFFKIKSIKLYSKNNVSFLVPPNIGTGYYVNSKEACLSYKQSMYYDIRRQQTILFSDRKLIKDLNFKNFFQKKKPIVSLRDKYGII